MRVRAATGILLLIGHRTRATLQPSHTIKRLFVCARRECPGPWEPRHSLDGAGGWGG
jgi:hypothetical protein